MENIQTKQKKKKGFTLIELIIVIAILGILALIAIPKFGSAQKDAKIKADVATAKTIANATATIVAQGKDTTIKEGMDKYVEVTSDNDLKPKLGSETVTVQALDQGKFYVKVDAEGNITVKVSKTTISDGNEGFTLYPTQDDKYPDGK